MRFFKLAIFHYCLLLSASAFSNIQVWATSEATCANLYHYYSRTRPLSGYDWFDVPRHPSGAPIEYVNNCTMYIYDASTGCNEGLHLITINDNPSFCSSASPTDVALDIYGTTGSNVVIDIDETTGALTVTTDVDIRNNQTGLADFPTSGNDLLAYTPPDNPTEVVDVVDTQTIVDGPETTVVEQTQSVNAADNTTTIETTETTTNSETEITTVTTTTTVVDNTTGAIVESQTQQRLPSDQQDENGRVSGGRSCSSPPSRSGNVSDAEFNVILQTYYLRCPPNKPTLSGEPKGFDHEQVSSKLEKAQEEYTLLINDINAEMASIFNLTLSSGDTIKPNIVKIKGVEIDFSFSRFTAELSLIGLVIIALAYLRAFFIIMTGEK